eukprot:3581481-Prorocentrum_lima.AAC.1
MLTLELEGDEVSVEGLCSTALSASRDMMPKALSCAIVIRRVWRTVPLDNFWRVMLLDTS